MKLTQLDDDQSCLPLAVTGIGVYSPLGKSPDEFWNRIEKGECAVKEIQSFPLGQLKVRHAAEITDHDPISVFDNAEDRQLDWTAQFGMIAAKQALTNAALDETVRNSVRLGLVVGVCAGGQGLSPEQRAVAADPYDITLENFPDAALYRQTDAIGKFLNIHGPRSTISTACASSGSALAYAWELLQANKADAILVGGTDAFSLSTYAGFYALGAMPEQPISPFSDNVGVSFGEGAGFVVLERLKHAESRNAKIHGLMLGYGCTGDAHHVTSPHPSGEGLQRAMLAAIERGKLSTSQIDYINAHGTATRDNDKAETSAIRELFKDRPAPPPVSSSKSQFGHTLGAAGILEFIVSILATKRNTYPATINFVAARPGCDLDYIPNKPRPGKIETFLSNSAAFGGINVSILGGTTVHRNVTVKRDQEEIWITGIGVVSPIGCGLNDFREGLLHGNSGIKPVTAFDVSDRYSKHAALIIDLKTRQLAPTIDVRRTDPLNRFAMVAAALAIKHSKLEIRAANSGRVGMVMSLNYGSLAVQERFRDSLRKDGIEKLSAKHFPSMVVSTVGGTVAQSFNLRGFNSTIADGITAGLHGLIHAQTVLQSDASQDAIVVVAADEIAQFLFNRFDQRGCLAPTTSGSDAQLGAYQSNSRGWLLGEGGVAIVLERAAIARARYAKPLAKITGSGLSADACLSPHTTPSIKWHAEAIRSSIGNAGLSTADIDLIYGHGRGESAHDAREVATLASIFRTHSTPLGCVMGNTGVAGSTSGLYSLTAAVLGLLHNEAYPVLGSTGDLAQGITMIREPLFQPMRNILVTGSTENGNHASVVVSKVEV